MKSKEEYIEWYTEHYGHKPSEDLIDKFEEENLTFLE